MASKSVILQVLLIIYLKSTGWKPMYLSVTMTILLIILIFANAILIFTKYGIDDTQLVYNEAFFTKTLTWDEIEFIQIQPSGYLKLSVAVLGESKKISINSAVNNYEELLRKIIERCRTNNKTKIEVRIFDILEIKY